MQIPDCSPPRPLFRMIKGGQPIPPSEEATHPNYVGLIVGGLALDDPVWNDPLVGVNRDHFVDRPEGGFRRDTNR